MKNVQTLEQKISGSVELGHALPEVPRYVSANLNPKLVLRPYQHEAFGRMIYYFANDKLRQRPSQLLFHMATGSGKTLIMAGAILHLYKAGYRNFLFFVNSTNIIEKTRANFLDFQHSKYLFADSIEIDGKRVRIVEVDNFQGGNSDSINIIFSTIQGLHVRLNNPKENTVTYDDFQENRVAYISDEAHHINVDTKKGKPPKEEVEIAESWETTVSRIFRSNNENVLLEFTATVDFNNEETAAKYSDKLIYDYPLRRFRVDGYSKEVEVLQSDTTSKFQRALQAVVLSQYRRKVFAKNRLDIKPVILFKSKTIAESKDFFDEFVEGIKALKRSDLQKVRATKDKVLMRCFDFLDRSSVNIDDFIEELKGDFSYEKCIEINSKEESDENQLKVNTLEDHDNEIRAIFAVDKLNEGWDVLNLFDIVRLYDTRNADPKKGNLGAATISEAQLIGRGARYCPFQIEVGQLKYQRKYDEDLDNELRVCEELYYHSAQNSRYIGELRNALYEIGIKDSKAREIQLELKDMFKESEFYQKGLIFTNELVKFDRSGIKSLPNTITEKVYTFKLETGAVSTSRIFMEDRSATVEKGAKTYLLANFGPQVLRKAIARLEFYRFDNLKSFLPNLESVSEFLMSKEYLGKVQVEVTGIREKIEALSSDERVQIVLTILEDVSEALQDSNIEYQGTKEFSPKAVSKVFGDKKLSIVVSDGGDQEYGIGQGATTNEDLRLDLSRRDWYAFKESYGTSEEKYLIKFIEKAYEKLESRYAEVYLLRNERHFKLYNFDDGSAFEPDFVLFLKRKDGEESLHYQVFIEPKGEHLLQQDAWKESLLKALKKNYRLEQLWKSRKYVIWGMPFFTQSNKQEFEKDFAFFVD